MNRKVQSLCLATLLVVLTLGGYVLSIVWRVSVAEHEVLGRSCLIKVFGKEPKFAEAPILQSFQSPTYTLNCDGIPIKVWSEKINGYQHTYGSALASFEIGECFADKLFVANEWAEWLFDKNGISQTDILDRRRDLSNNRVGRHIGTLTRLQGLTGSDAERFMRVKVLSTMELDGTIITHPSESRVLALSEAELGCPYLPEQNIFDLSKTIKHRLRKAKNRLIRRACQIIA